MGHNREKQALKRVGGVNRVREALSATRSVAKAAQQLGVDRSTVHRWCEEYPELRAVLDERRAASDRAVRDGLMAVQSGPLGPKEWELAIVKERELTVTERVQLDLARRALELAHDADARPSDRLAAMGRFQRLIEPLNFEPAPAVTPTKAPTRPEPAQRLADPRVYLRSVS